MVTLAPSFGLRFLTSAIPPMVLLLPKRAWQLRSPWPQPPPLLRKARHGQCDDHRTANFRGYLRQSGPARSLASLRSRRVGRFMVGSDEWWITLFRGVTLRSPTRPRSHRPSVPGGHRSALRRISGTLLVRSGLGRLGCPAERHAVDPHAMQDDGQPARNGDHRPGHAPAFGDAQAPGLERRVLGLWS